MNIESKLDIKQTPEGFFVEHLDLEGNPLSYPLPPSVKTMEEAKELVKVSKLAEIVLLAESNALSHEAISRILCGSKLTVSTARDKWLEWLRKTSEGNTVSMYESFIKRWIKTAKIGGLFPSQITEADIDPFVNPDDNTKAATRNLKLAAIRSFFKFCLAKGYTYHNPSLLIKVRMSQLKHFQKETVKTIPITTSQVKNLLNSMDRIKQLLRFDLRSLDTSTTHGQSEYTRLLNKLGTYEFWECAIIISHETALRLVDVAGLEWDSWGADHLVVWTEKKDTRVELPLSELLRAVKDKIPHKDAVYCFPEQKQKVTSVLATQFKRICAECGVEYTGFHGIRKGTLQRWKRQGFTLEEVAKKAGHGSTKSTEGYL